MFWSFINNRSLIRGFFSNSGYQWTSFLRTLDIVKNVFLRVHSLSQVKVSRSQTALTSAHPRPGKHLPPFVGTTLTYCTYLDYQFQKSTSHFRGISNSFYQNNTPIYRRLLVDDIPAISFGPLIAPLTAC